MAFTVLIPARLASTRLPNKPLADIAGKPMVVRVAERAAQSAAAQVVVATDAPAIMAACAAHGVQALLTRADHASGSDRLAEACEQLGLPDSQDWQVSLEWLDPDNLLAEPRRSQIDAVARSAENLIFFECKFTEQSAGACTQPNLRRGVRQCNSNYELQTNPINNKTARCALTAKGIRYWEHIPEIFTFGADQDHTPCPFAGSWYQWMRNLVQCSTVARHYNLRPAFVVTYADGPFAVAKEIRSSAWQRFLSTLRPRHLPLATLSYQELVALGKQNSAPQEMATWQALEEWVNRKIKSVVGSTPV